ncbi:response regulator transcription factor [Nocardiopsis alborubida]|uniref:response regulator transcription factor n=1 Tax=Nocardiopsis alborubida TaxID=146802 RepID=UPI00076E486D|nr:response regulator transcription factor [Nocardiopsis alborubida]
MIRVLVAEDEHLIREAMVALLVLEPDLEVIAQAASGHEAVAMAREHGPDVAVLDLRMPGLDGIAAAKTIIRHNNGCRTLILTSHGLPGHLKRSLEAGVKGFVPKMISAAKLADAIRAVHGGDRYIDPSLAADAISAGDSPLSAREADILALAADGATVNEIAQRASLAPGTVRNYLSSAVTKLEANNRHSAVHIARSHGWI